MPKQRLEGSAVRSLRLSGSKAFQADRPTCSEAGAGLVGLRMAMAGVAGVRRGGDRARARAFL